MHLISTSILAATFWTLATNALPRPIVTYSVVNVDGGSQTAATPTVVYETITKSNDTPETISVTMTAVTTQWTAAEATETALIPEVSVQPEHPHHHISGPQPTETTTIVSMVTPSPSPTTTKYYDNGQWHTSYAVKHWSSASGSHPGQWVPAASSGVASASGAWQSSGSAAPSGYASRSGWNSSASY